MKVIVKKDLQHVARKNQVKQVADGFAINFLIPNGFAIAATPESEKALAMTLKTADAEKKVQHALLEKNMSSIVEARLTILAKANEKGHLFSGIHKEEIMKALKAQAHLDIPADMIMLDKPLKETGQHKVKIGTGERVAMLALEIIGEK